MYDKTKLSTFGNELMMLYGRANLSQGEFARLLGISSVALRKWESGESCPKAESVKRVMEVLLSKGVFSKGAELTEAMHLWELANQKGLKVPFDEMWFRGVMQGQAGATTGAVGADRAGPYPVPCADSGPRSDHDSNDFAVGIVPCVDSNPSKTRGQSKRLLRSLIALVILIIAGSAGTFFFYARDHATTQANKTDQAYPGYLSGKGTLAFFDPLNQERGSKWDSSRTESNSGSCQFTSGAYHVSEQLSDYFASCFAHGVFSNFAFEVQLTIVQGDCGGMTFREDDNGHFYKFSVCQDGSYRVVKYVSSTSGSDILYSGRSSAIHTGPGHQNKMAVEANGSTMTFYVNEQQIDQEQDSSSTSGKIKLIADPHFGDATDVAYSNARLWTL